MDTTNSRLVAYDLSTTMGWSYNQIGNITYNDGAAYTYGSKPHAVTSAGSTSYAYDSDGNMTTRGNQSLTWDVENRMTAITNVATFVYDGNGFRVKKTESSNTILYVNKYYEKNTTTGTVTLYYYLGGKLVAYKEVPEEGQATLRYINQDHLTGTSLTTDSSGNSAGTIRYKPYGETDASSGTLPAQKFTGQRLDNTGLYYYGARYYDPGLARFISADSFIQQSSGFNSVSSALTVNIITAGLGGLKSGIYPLIVLEAPIVPQALNRYSYVINNPLCYTDPYGWWTFGLGININFGGLGIGFSFSGMGVISSRGGIGLVWSGGGGGYGGYFGAALAVQAQATTANTVEQLRGPAVQTGGSATIGPLIITNWTGLNVGAEHVVGKGYQGVSIQAGLGTVGPMPYEMHGFAEDAGVKMLRSDEGNRTENDNEPALPVESSTTGYNWDYEYGMY